MTPTAVRRVPVRVPLDLRSTLSVLGFGGHDATACWEPGDVFARSTWTPAGPATVRIWREGADLCGQGWGPGGPWLVERLEHLAGLTDALESWEPAGERVQRLAREWPGWRLPRLWPVTDLLMMQVLGQLVSGLEHLQAWRRLVAELGEAGPGGVRLPPSPMRLAASPSWALMRAGALPKQAHTMRAVGLVTRRLEEVAGMEADAADRRLQAVHGVGPWTSRSVLLRGQGHADLVPPGDYNLPHLVAFALAGEPRADDARMLELLAPNAGNRGRVVLLLERSGVKAPRFGPRMATRRLL